MVAALRGPPDLSGLLPELERRVFIHYRRGFARGGNANGNNNGNEDPPEEGASTCFSFLANGAAWNGVADYVSTFAITTSVGEWNAAANNVGADIFGTRVGGEVPPFTGDLDEVNSAQFGAYANSNAIAVTVVWGVFRGPPSQRRLVEWDILMNGHLAGKTGGTFLFGDATSNPNVMDTQNIVAHELGHAAGLGHAPSGCTEETMFGFAGVGETNKRSLEAGDRAGINALY